MERAARRRLFGAGFLVGVACWVLLGGLIAAYDLWGGVPRTLWPLARLLASVGALLVLAGGMGWVLSWPVGRRLRAAAWAAGALALTGALIGGALFAHYALRRETSRSICAPALVAATRAEREQALREGLGPLFPVIDPDSSCLTLLREKRELERSEACPSFVMTDTPCRCGKQSWQPPATGRCPDGPTACQYRTQLDESTLGCAEHGTLYLLEQAQAAKRARR